MVSCPGLAQLAHPGLETAEAWDESRLPALSPLSPVREVVLLEI